MIWTGEKYLIEVKSLQHTSVEFSEAKLCHGCNYQEEIYKCFKTKMAKLVEKKSSSKERMYRALPTHISSWEYLVSALYSTYVAHRSDSS